MKTIFKTIVYMAFFIFILNAIPTHAQTSISFEGVYMQGSGPFNKKTKVMIQRNGENYDFTPIGSSGGMAWSVPISTIRGAQSSDTGLWFYWFDASDNTLDCYIKMSQHASELAQEITAAVTQPRQGQGQTMGTGDIDQYKARYEAYRQQAIDTAR
jgi:carboxylesterase type B